MGRIPGIPRNPQSGVNRMKLPIGIALGAACLAGTAWSQTEQLRPGLWEHQMAVKGGGQAAAMAKAQQQMANLPPDQRQMIEKMMADKGIAMGPKGTSVRVCMTKDDVERQQFPEQEGCTQNVKRNGDTWTVTFQCKRDPPTRGEGTMRILSPTAYSGDFVIDTVVGGKAERMEMAQTGKWLGADCGALAPKSRR